MQAPVEISGFSHFFGLAGLLVLRAAVEYVENSPLSRAGMVFAKIGPARSPFKSLVWNFLVLSKEKGVESQEATAPAVNSRKESRK